MKYMMVVQWRGREVAFDRLVELEGGLIKAMKQSRLDSDCDGHDMGNGECNLFIHTNQPRETFRVVQSFVRGEGEETGLAVAFRLRLGDDYTILWPPGSTEFNVT